MIRIPALTSEEIILGKSSETAYPPIDKEIIEQLLGGAADGALPQESALRLLDAIGISREKTLVTCTIMEAKLAAIDIGYPINMQGISVHGGEEKELVENITDENTMRLEFKRLMLSSEARSVLISPALSGARAYFGIRRRARLGHLVICGTYASSQSKPEAFTACTLPVTKAEAREMFARVKGSFQLNEIIFTDTLRRLSALCEAAPQIESMDIMPVVASARNVVALDAAVNVKNL